jgi:hypothetical protein
MQGGRQQAGQLGGVAAQDGGAAGRAGSVGVGDIGVGDVGPAGFVFDADRVAAGVNGFDERGADPAHRIQHEIAGLGVGGYGVRGDGGQHPRWMFGRGGKVAAASLGRAGGLRGDPHRQPPRTHVVIRVIDDHGVPAVNHGCGLRGC